MIYADAGGRPKVHYLNDSLTHELVSAGYPECPRSCIGGPWNCRRTVKPMSAAWLPGAAQRSRVARREKSRHN